MSIFKRTATYGKGFKKTEVEDQYSIRIYTTARGAQAATERVKQEADKFLEESKFSGYEIVDARPIWFPFSCIEYTLKFRP
jgi:hypothetical protein